MMLSKELAKAVFGSNKAAFYSDGEVLCITMNTYEIMHYCKEWARKQSKPLTIVGYDDTFVVYVNFKHTLDASAPGMGGKIHSYDVFARYSTEAEAVFAACEWILKNQSD